jgi:ubiquinone/menaquinone biosynthesis C-methylase UbiE
VYQLVRKYQFRKKLKLINSLINKNEKKLLDVGCGTGEFLNYCKKRNWTVNGIETDEKTRNYAINFQNCEVVDTLDKIIKQELKFDVITLWHVLEHVYDFKDYLFKLKGILNKGGYIILGLPNCKSYDAKFYKENWYAFDLPIHVSHFNKNDIHHLVSEFKFNSLLIKPLIFDAYYISMLSSKKSGNSLLLGLLHGWISNKKAKKNLEYSSLMYLLKTQ